MERICGVSLSRTVPAITSTIASMEEARPCQTDESASQTTGITMRIECKSNEGPTRGKLPHTFVRQELFSVFFGTGLAIDGMTGTS